ncbi:hypothetical protein PFWH6_2918 [Pseudomonas fluorescens WH6]|nr:hypothetical protein PFWH6_2918 [Pseudomonas fluorescens WH6]
MAARQQALKYIADGTGCRVFDKITLQEGAHSPCRP